ncbi:MAG TPA: permease-like cell division protein FtsX [Candidatus Paceibacterota bacterium]
MQNFLTGIRRVAKQGFVTFWRAGVVSFTGVFVSTVTLFIIGAVIIANAFLGATLTELEGKVDVNVYFVTTAAEEDIMILKGKLEALPEVAYVEYVNREDALARFIERNKGDADITLAIDEIGENPLGAVLNIKAHEPKQYLSIVSYLETQTENVLAAGNQSIVDEVNYADNQEIIDRLSALTTSARELGIFVSLIVIAMSALVTASTVRLAIYNSRQEISVMRLVGANNSYIRGPFVIEGVMYGFVAAILSAAILYPATLWVTKTTEGVFGGINVVQYYVANLGQILIILLLSGIVLGMFSSYLAVRRYLKA